MKLLVLCSRKIFVGHSCIVKLKACTTKCYFLMSVKPTYTYMYTYTSAERIWILHRYMYTCILYYHPSHLHTCTIQKGQHCMHMLQLLATMEGLGLGQLSLCLQTAGMHSLLLDNTWTLVNAVYEYMYSIRALRRSKWLINATCIKPSINEINRSNLNSLNTNDDTTWSQAESCERLYKHTSASPVFICSKNR